MAINSIGNIDILKEAANTKSKIALVFWYIFSLFCTDSGKVSLDDFIAALILLCCGGPAFSLIESIFSYDGDSSENSLTVDFGISVLTL